MDLPSPFIAVIIYGGLNLLVFAAFACDKLMAKANAWRTPENALLLSAVLAPSGALAAMIVFRHKTRHLKFCLVPLFLVLHLLLIVRLWPQISG